MACGRYRLEIDPSGAAFADAPPGYELARILRRLADRLEGGERASGMVERDLNGNTCAWLRWDDGGEK